jgi:hypothetical protein
MRILEEYTMTVNKIRPAAPELPATSEQWIRKTKAQRTLNDLVEDIHLMLAETDEYKKYLKAIFAEQSSEGSLYADDLELARLIREKAIEIGSVELANEKKATIVKCLNIVLRRYELSRAERRDSVQSTKIAA